MGTMNKTFMSFAIAALLFEMAIGETYIVGSPNGSWDENTNLQSWIKSQMFRVGDNISKFTCTAAPITSSTPPATPLTPPAPTSANPLMPPSPAPPLTPLPPPPPPVFSSQPPTAAPPRPSPTSTPAVLPPAPSAAPSVSPDLRNAMVPSTNQPPIVETPEILSDMLSPSSPPRPPLSSANKEHFHHLIFPMGLGFGLAMILGF